MTQRPDLREKIRQLPHKPGVYLYKDRFNKIIYVGKARDLHKRVSQYFHPSRRQKADLKTRALVESIWDLETHTVHSEPEALLLEGKLIKEYRPRYNINFRDDKRFLMVKIQLSDPYPRFQLTRMKKEDGARYYGPFVNPNALRSTLELMKRRFHLRSCRPQVPGENDFKHCLDHIIKQCSAPCVARVSQEAYLAQVKEACDFLEGRSSHMLEKIEQEMRKAAAELHFEKAAELRNMLADIKSTTRQERERKFVRQIPSTVIPERDLESLQQALTLPNIPAVIECFDISNISTTHKVASMVQFRQGRPDRSNYRRYRIKTVAGQDDFASMAEVVGRRYTRVLREGGKMPDLIVVDGGKGQLSSALRELEALQQTTQPIIGLAKEREEIFRPHQSDPIILPHETGALRLLQRIRDEAHRFANGYHQLLLKKRTQESLLDDCPGMSHSKKMALLRHFKSVDKIRKATVEELTQAESIGPKLAQSLVDFFARIKNQKTGSIDNPLVYTLKRNPPNQAAPNP
jgi:excinuclease ABC subunit C